MNKFRDYLYRLIGISHRYLILVIIFVVITFSILYSNLRVYLSYSNPYSSKISRSHVDLFFKNTCELSFKGANLTHFIEYSPLACEYHYSDLIFKISYLSYNASVLSLRIAAIPVGSNEPSDAKMGLIIIDLSNLESPSDKALVRIVPYLSFDKYLIQPLPQSFRQNNLESPLWGEVLGRNLLGLGKDGGTPSLTVGQDHPYWLNKRNNHYFKDLKRFFEFGDMKNADWKEFVVLSFQILTASNTGEIIPNSWPMRILLSLQSLIAILLLGVLVSVVFELINIRTLKDPKKNPNN